MQSRETNEEFAREQENANKGWETCYGAALKARLKWIDQMLMERHLAKKARRASGKNHLKGPKKRTTEDDERFAESFEKLIGKALEKNEK